MMVMHLDNFNVVLGAEQARRRVTDTILDHLDGEGNEQLIIRLDRIAHTVEGIFFRTTHMLSLPSVNFNALMSKWSFAVYMLVLFLAQVAGLTLVGMFIVNLSSYLGSHQLLNAYDSLQRIVTNVVFQTILLLLIFIHGRTVLFRMDDKEI